jgi:hypothetical protein
VASGPLGPAKRAAVIALAAEARLPAIYSFRIFPADGGLMSFAADYADLYRRAASFVDKILKGTPPAELPVEPPRRHRTWQGGRPRPHQGDPALRYRASCARSMLPTATGSRRGRC